MRLRTIVRAGTIIFGLILLAGTALFVVASIQVGWLSAQVDIAERVERSADNISYLSDEFVEYGEERQRRLWETEFASLANAVARLAPDTAEEQSRVAHISENIRRTRAVFDDVAARAGAGAASGDPSAAEAFKHLAFSRLAVHNRMVVADAVALSRGLRKRADDSVTRTLGLLLGILAAFIVFFLGVHVRINRRMFESLSLLQRGTKIVGDGNLSHRINYARRDEFGDLTGAFNAMTARLGETTASKRELEEEVDRRRRTEAALRSSEERFATTLASIADAVLATDVHGVIAFLNGAAARLTGIAAAGALGRPLSEILVLVDGRTGDPIADPVAAVLETGTQRPLGDQTVLIRADGTRVPVADSGAPILDRDGEISGVVLVMSDVTEQRRAEEVLRRDHATLERLVEEKSRDLLAARREAEESRRLSDIGTFAASVAHDLRNPLNVMSIALYNIKRKTDIRPIETHVRTIEGKIKESERIIHNVLQYSRRRAAAKTEVDLYALVAESAQAAQVGFRKRAAVTLRPEEPVIIRLEADPVQLRELFQNILSNALDAVPDEAGAVDISIDSNDNLITVAVSDNGPGVAPANREKIFDPFFTTKPDGIGLGLAICRRIVAFHNGSLSLADAAGGGTTILLTFPSP